MSKQIFPYKILILCLVLPPVFYILTIQSLEGYLQRRENDRLNEILIQHPEALYEGRYSVGEEINRNISKYLSNGIQSKIGVRNDILVKTRDGRILYPPAVRPELKDSLKQDPMVLNYVEVAAENYRLLNEGLSMEAVIKVRQNSWLSNSILIFYLGLSFLLLRRVMKRGLAESERREEAHQELMTRLGERLNSSRNQLEGVVKKEKEYLERIDRLKRDKHELTRDVDGLLEELEQQETGLQDHRKHKEALEKNLAELREKLQRLTARGEKRKKRKGKYNSLAKRFRLLYKNLELSERALTGFSGLPEELKLKAEEVIHQLNEDASLITIKRKVFGKGGKMDVLEVNFAYSGRLYFRKNAKGGMRVLAIGTKNTQVQDLPYLESAK